jgi:hypothetical protein
MRWKDIAIASMLPLIGTANASNNAPIGGIYSDLRSNAESGDLDGTEFLIMYQGYGYLVFYQFWEGGSLPPVIAPVKVNGHEISFKVPAPSGECGFYRGIITSQGFDGICTIPHPAYQLKQIPVHLRRKHSYWDNSN